MTIWTDTIGLAAGAPAATDHRAPAKTPLAAAVRRAIASLRRWPKRRKAIAELSVLDDRMLRDIGVSRGQIRELVDAQLRLQAGAGTS